MPPWVHNVKPSSQLWCWRKCSIYYRTFCITMQSSKLQYILTYPNTHLSEHQSMHMHCARAMTSAVNYVVSAPCHWGIRKSITNAWLIVWLSLLQPPMLLVGDAWVARWSKAVIVAMVWIILNALTYLNKFSYPNRRRNWLALCC